MLFLQSPSTGKALAVPDNLGIDHASLAQALGSTLPATPPEELRPELVTLADVAPRLDSVATAAGPEFPRRVAYVFGGGGETQAEFVRRAQALREADVAVALARFRLAEQLAAHDVRLALIERMQEMMGQATSRLDSLSRELVAARDSLARVSQSAEEQRTLLHEMMHIRQTALASQTMAGAPAAAGISDDDRDTSPFYHRDDIQSVSVLTETVKSGKGSTQKEVGATVVFRAVPGMTVEWLQRVVDCHLARAAAVGHDMPEMSYCPLMPKGVKAKVTSVGNGFAVNLSADDAATVAEIEKRAQALAPGAAAPIATSP